MAKKKQDDSLLLAGRSKLMQGFQQRLAKAKVKGVKDAEFDVMYPTGFLSLDYLNGTMIHVKSDQLNMSYKSVGVMDGTSNTFIGRTGCGKSTLCVQIIGNILRQYPDSDAYIDDIEGSLPMSRKEFLLGLNYEDLQSRVKFRNTGITTENVYGQIRAIRDEKVENREAYEYDTGLYDIYGNRIYKMIPTLYFIDSFAMLMPDDVTEDEALGNSGMGASGIAKANTALIKKISQLLKEANIILFTINHIMDNIQIGMFPKPATIPGLKPDERVPGGKAAAYLANNLFRLDEKNTLKETEGYGINGSVVDLTICKSRSNQNKRSIPLIFNKTEGEFDNILSLFHLLKTEGKIGGAGAYLYLDCRPDIKFSQKNFKNELATNPELQQAFAVTCKEVLEEFLSDTRAKEVDGQFDINNMILSLA